MICAHLKSSVVGVGHQVQRRQHIAFADNSGINTSASQLHRMLKKAGATARGETRFPYDIVGPTTRCAAFTTARPGCSRTARGLGGEDR